MSMNREEIINVSGVLLDVIITLIAKYQKITQMNYEEVINMIKEESLRSNRLLKEEEEI